MTAYLLHNGPVSLFKRQA